jgi:hypothetical protein
MTLSVEQMRDLGRATLRTIAAMAPEEPDTPLDPGDLLLQEAYQDTLRRICDSLKVIAVEVGEDTPGGIPRDCREHLHVGVHPEGILIEWKVEGSPQGTFLATWQAMANHTQEISSGSAELPLH